MLDRIRELAVNGQWQEVIEQGGILLASNHGLQGDDVAWVHLIIGTGHFETDGSVEGRRQSLRHAVAAYKCATPGGMRHTAALQKVSSLLVDTGRHEAARWYAHAFLKAAPHHPALAGRIGWALRDLGIIAMRSGLFGAASKWYSRSINAFAAAGHETEATRGRLHLVWAYSMARRPDRARLVMPVSVPDELTYFFLSSLAVLAAAEGDWHQALKYAEESLSHQRPDYDTIDAADLCMLASRAARRQGANADALKYEYRATALAALQGLEIQAVLLLNTERKGGEFLEATASLRGSSDLRDRGCFTTGIA